VPLAPPGFRSIDCRLAALLARVNGESRLGSFQSKLAAGVQRARSQTAEAAGLCGQANLKKTKNHLQQGGTAVTQYLHRRRGLAGKKKLDRGVRESFIADGEPIQADLKAFRGAARCPDDAAR